MADQYGNTVDGEIWVPVTRGELVITKQAAHAAYPPERALEDDQDT